LIKAADSGFTHIAQTLLDAGASTDLQDEVGMYFSKFIILKYPSIVS